MYKRQGLAGFSLAGILLQDRKLKQRWPADYGHYAAQTTRLPFTGAKEVSAQKTGTWSPWLWGLVATAVIGGPLHFMVAWHNGAGFMMLVVLFGLVAVGARMFQATATNTSS